MEERKVGVVRNVTVEGLLGTKEYDIVVTNERTILVLQSAVADNVARAVAGGFGAAVANAVSGDRDIDIRRVDPSTLASDPKNLAIPHGAIQSLSIVKRWARHRIRLEYTNASGGRAGIEAVLDIPKSVVKEAERAGVHPKEAIRQHVENVRDVFLRGLPADVIRHAVWEI